MTGLGYEGRTVVVTGGSSGMGDAAVRLLSDRLGARVHVVDIAPPSASHESFHETDIADPQSVAATGAALRELGPIDFYFSCAGIGHTFPPLKVMGVNYIGARQLLDATIPALADGAGIAIIASQAGMMWQANLASNLELFGIADPVEALKWCEAHPDRLHDAYSFSKEMLIVYAAHECIRLGEQRRIRINCTAPCPTRTAFMTQAIEGMGEEFFDRYPYPSLGRMATPEEQAWPLVLLNSPLNNTVSGSVLYTDQGFSGGVCTGALDVSALIPEA